MRVRIGIGAALVLVAAAGVAAVVVASAGGGGSTTVTTITASTSAPRVDGAASDGGVGDGTGRVGAPGPAPTASTAAGVLVHVAGAVRHPGLYRLAAGSRVVDAVAAAGGFTKDAVRAGVNLARAVADGEQLVVPSAHGGGAVGPAAGAAPPAPGATGTTAPVNLNTATAEQLEALPRIGPAMAQRILAWRSSHGSFDRVEDLMNVSGIGQKTFDGLKDRITV